MAENATLQKNLREAIALQQSILENSIIQERITHLASEISSSFRKGNKVLFCGNGGSAADAQHLAAELSGRYYYDRPPLFAEALHVNSSYITAVSNDYSFDEVYARLVQAMGVEGDTLIGLSTSGNSPNVVNALRKAKDIGMKTVAFTGAGGGEARQYADDLIEIESTNTPRIQECHMLLGHTLCELIEKTLFPRQD